MLKIKRKKILREYKMYIKEMLKKNKEYKIKYKIYVQAKKEFLNKRLKFRKKKKRSNCYI